VCAPSGGTVKEIKVKVGDTVEDDALLLVLE
jgi:biotin carboxyl carrier protein